MVEPQGVRLANELSRGPREGTQARSAWSSLAQCLAQVLRLGDVDRPQLQVPARAPDGGGPDQHGRGHGQPSFFQLLPQASLGQGALRTREATTTEAAQEPTMLVRPDDHGAPGMLQEIDPGTPPHRERRGC